MVTSEDEITRRLQERDSARSARREKAATTVGDLARRHTALARQLADLERELGEVLTAAGEDIDVPELAQVTDVPAADLTRWRDKAAKPARSGKRTRPSTKKTTPSKGGDAETAPRVAGPAAPATPVPESVGAGGVAVGTASS